jgi:flagellar motor protein MotB
LFGALLIATFGGLMMMYSGAKQMVEKNQAQNAVLDRLSKTITKHDPGGLGAIKREGCDPDICIDVDVLFPTNEYLIGSDEQRRSLCSVCQRLRSELDTLADVRDVQIVVEGHTDDTNTVSETDPRRRFIKNWELSTNRANAVLYEMKQCGLDPARYNVVSIGFADSQRICEETTMDCRKRNRRTTLRLRTATKDHFQAVNR